MLTPDLMAKNMFDELAESTFSATTLRGRMNTDIKESDQGYELDVDLPGVYKEKFAAELKDGYLCISATVEQTHNDNVQNERYLRRERFIGSCRRSFYVGDKIKQEGHPRQVRGRHPAPVHPQSEPGGSGGAKEPDCY